MYMQILVMGSTRKTFVNGKYSDKILQHCGGLDMSADKGC